MRQDPTARRLQGYVEHYTAAYAAQGRTVWARLGDRRLEGAGRWSEWCWLPMSEMADVQLEVLTATGLPDRERTPQVQAGLTRDVSALAALAAWRVGRGIYRLDHTLLQALWETPVRGDLPGAVLQRLPEWCVYVEAPVGITHLGAAVLGFWAHLEFDHRSGMELRLLPDLRPAAGQRLPPWFPLAVLLGGTVQEGLARYLGTPDAPAELTAWAEGAVSVLLYLCSLRAEYVGPRTPERASAQQVRRSRHAEAPTTVWEIGARLGATLRASGVGSGLESGGVGQGGRRSPRAHLRAAHWTTVWTGPRNGAQVPAARWIPPTPIMAGDGEGPAVVHPVKG